MDVNRSPEYKEERVVKPSRPHAGRHKKPKPEGWEEVAEMVKTKVITQQEGVRILGISVPTFKKWLAERVSDSESC